MSARAFIKDDWQRDGIQVFLLPDEGKVVRWDSIDGFGFPTVTDLDPRQEAPDSAGLRLPEVLARALYEALADHFGHSGHDTRALRKDYDAERARVDKFIALLTGGGR